MLNKDMKNELVNYYTKFDSSSSENCPAVNDVTVAQNLTRTHREALCSCNTIDSPSCFTYVPHCCSIFTNKCEIRSNCITSIEYSVNMWNTPQVVEKGQVCDLRTNRCVYQFDCSNHTECNSYANQEAKESVGIKNCTKHRDCAIDTRYTNVFTRKERLAWYVTDQSFSLEFGLSRAQVFVEVEGCPDREGCYLQNPSLDWEKMKNISEKAGELYAIPDDVDNW